MIPDFLKKQEKSNKHPNLLPERLQKRRAKKTQSQKKERNDKRLARRWWLHRFVIETQPCWLGWAALLGEAGQPGRCHGQNSGSSWPDHCCCRTCRPLLFASHEAYGASSKTSFSKSTKICKTYLALLLILCCVWSLEPDIHGILSDCFRPLLLLPTGEV